MLVKEVTGVGNHRIKSIQYSVRVMLYTDAVVLQSNVGNPQFVKILSVLDKV